MNKHFGNYGTYVVSIVLCSLSVAYMLIFIKEPKKEYQKTIGNKETDALTDSKRSMSKKVDATVSCDFEPELTCDFLQIGYVIQNFFITPLKEFTETIAKRRDNNLRRLLIVQILAYSVYWSVTEYSSILYLYMIKVRKKENNSRNRAKRLHEFFQHMFRSLTGSSPNSTPICPWLATSSTS